MMLKKIYFRDVEVRQRFCFIWMNDKCPQAWDIKLNEVEYENLTGVYSVDNLEDYKDSIVLVEVENES